MAECRLALDAVSQQVFAWLADVRELYHRLVLLVGRPGAGKSRVLRQVSRAISAPLLNLNLELSSRMLDLTERQRALRLPGLLNDLVAEVGGQVILLDNTELLFDPHLLQDPLRLLQGLSRDRTVVAAWGGAVERGCLTYAAPGHPEYRQYLANGLMIVELGEGQGK